MPGAVFIKPCLPIKTSAPPKGDRWLHEPKFDGWRVIAVKNDSDVQFFTRTGSLLKADCATIAEEISWLRPRTLVLDGELVMLDEKGQPNFYRLTGALNRGEGRACVYYAFDLLHVSGRDCRPFPLEARKQRLRKLLLRSDHHHVRYVKDYPDGSLLFDEACRLGLEGVVSKLRDASYHSGRAPMWQKVRCSKARKQGGQRRR